MKLKNFEMCTKEQMQHKLTASELKCIEGGSIGERYRRKRGEWEEPTSSKNVAALSVLDKINDAAKDLADKVGQFGYNLERKAGVSPTRGDKVTERLNWFVDNVPGAEMFILKTMRDGLKRWYEETP